MPKPKRDEKQPRRRPTGAEHLRDAGLVTVTLAMPPEEREQLRVAAAMAGVSSRQFATDVVRTAVRKVLAEKGL